MILPTASVARSIFLLLPILSSLATAARAVIPNPEPSSLLDNPTPSPKGTISGPIKASGTGCRVRTDQADTPPADAILTNPTSENTQTLILYYPTNGYDLHLPNSPDTPPGPTNSFKYCNGTVTLSYPPGWALKVEGISYSFSTSAEFSSSGLAAQLSSTIEITPGRGAGSGIYVIRAGEGTGGVVHSWVYRPGPGSTGGNRLKYFSLAEMAGTKPGEPLPVLTSACGAEDRKNEVRVRIDTRAELLSRGGTRAARDLRSFDDLQLQGTTPALRFGMVRLYIKWEACW